MLSTEAIATLAAHWLEPDEGAAWDAFVTQHPRGLVYHRTSWKRVLEQAFPHIRGRFLVLRDTSTGAIQAGLPLYTVKSWLLGNRVVSVPFASFCDPLISSVAEFEQLLPNIQEVCRDTSCQRLELRTRKTVEPFVTAPLAAVSTYRHHFLPLDKDLKALFGNFAKAPIRQMVAKASKAGVIVMKAEDNDSVKTCHDILTQTRRRLCLPPMPFTFFAAMRSNLSSQDMKIFLALHNGRPVGCHLVLTARDLWTSEYSGNTDDAIRGVNQLLYWETIKAAHTAGAKVFSFGRTSVANEGLLVYKRRWGTIEEDLVYFSPPSGAETTGHTAKKEHGYYSAGYRVARFVAGIVPRFMFQRIGDFCYRHLG